MTLFHTTGSWSACIYSSLFHFSIPPVLVACLERLLPLWRTTLYLNLPNHNAVIQSVNHVWYFSRGHPESIAILSTNGSKGY